MKSQTHSLISFAFFFLKKREKKTTHTKTSWNKNINTWYNLLEFEASPSMETQSNFHTSHPAFPISALVILTIIFTAFLLISSYMFLSKFCSNSHQLINLLIRRTLSVFHHEDDHDDPFIAFSPSMWNHGLEDSIIWDIPTFRFTRRRYDDQERRIYGCVVCLNEFEEEDRLRILPNCGHIFHLDCINIWFQTNPNCPLCRLSISGTNPSHPIHIIAPSSSPQDNSHSFTGTDLVDSDDDFVVIEVGGEDRRGVLLDGEMERQRSEMISRQEMTPKKVEEQIKMTRKSKHVSIMGDEFIDLVREKDDEFCIQPIRRSFSLDSAIDQQLYLTVQAMIQQNYRHGREIISS